MSTTYSPRIITNDLVLAFDAGSERSFRGEPTTNLISNANTMSSWTNYYRTTLSTTFTTEFGTTGYRFINQPSWNGIVRGFNLVNTGTYTFSAWIRYLNGSTSNNGATVYISNYGGGDTATAINKSIIGKWQRISKTVNVTSPGNVLFYLISYGGVDNGTGNPDFSSWEVTMPQIESKSYMTPFVNGTRGTTVDTGGGLIDLSGGVNSGELENGPIFNSSNNGSLQFDGVNDFVSTTNTPTKLLGNPSFTVSGWFYRESNLPVNTGLWGFGGNVTNQGINSWWSNNNNQITIDTWGQATFTTSVDLPLQQWVYVTWQKIAGPMTRNNCILWRNLDSYTGNQLTILRSENNAPNINNNGVTIGRISKTYNVPVNIRVGQFLVYDRILSSNEITQNFNTTKRRYGL